MITSRGCAYGRCTFCFGMSKCQFRRRSTDITIEEIKYLQDKYKIKDIVFWDNEFVVGDKWVNEFCNKLHREKIDITWSCYARANFVNKNILKIMADAGCWNVYYGLESGNQDLLDNISKGITLQQTRDAIKWTSEAGMESRGAFILGLPGETPLKGKQTIDFAISLGLDYAQFSFATPYPGTKFYDTSSKYGKILSTDYSKMTLEHPVFLPNGYKDISQLIELRKVAYRRFYMNPSYFLLRLKKLRRTEDFRRYVKGIQYLIADKLFKSN